MPKEEGAAAECTTIWVRVKPSTRDSSSLVGGSGKRHGCFRIRQTLRHLRMEFPDIQCNSGTPGYCWMPDFRRVLLSLAVGDASEQLWLADIASGDRQLLTSGTASRSSPAVSPDGKRIVFRETTGSFDIVSVDLASAAVRPLIVTERDELTPSWAAHKPLLAYVTDLNGPEEIWLQAADNSDRPAVTARDFPGVALQWLMGPGWDDTNRS